MRMEKCCKWIGGNMEEKYIYHISYTYKKEGGTGLGSGLYTLDARIDSIKNYNIIQEYIKETNNFDNVAILFFKELKENEE